jgi:hypothetical protein
MFSMVSLPCLLPSDFEIACSEDGVTDICTLSTSSGQQMVEVLKTISLLLDGSQHRLTSKKKKRNTVLEVKFLPQIHSRKTWRRNKVAKPRNRKIVKQRASQ